MTEPALARSAREVDEIAARCAAAETVAVDVEADGLFAFRAKLCTVQLAWREGAATAVAVIDALAADVSGLAGVLGPEGPVKVLHDLTFDARLLEESGAPLARVRDTSVAARLLGYASTGLAALLSSELGIALDKRLQHHDWARRPIGAVELRYLAEDVAHLVDLDERLAAKALALDIAEEIADECAYKLATAARPPRDARPPYVRMKGAAELDATGRAILRRLVMARDEVAESANVPPFKVIGNDALLDLARQRPTERAALEKVRGAVAGRAGRHAGAWLAAVARGVADGDIPEEDRAHFERPRGVRGAQAARRVREGQITAWRRAEAKVRGVPEQAILPGHCAQDLLEILLAPDPDDAALRARIAAVPGLGARRFERYADALAALARAPLPAPPQRAPESEPEPDPA